jgi:hypothetical protein
MEMVRRIETEVQWVPASWCEDRPVWHTICRSTYMHVQVGPVLLFLSFCACVHIIDDTISLSSCLFSKISCFVRWSIEAFAFIGFHFMQSVIISDFVDFIYFISLTVWLFAAVVVVNCFMFILRLVF